MIFPRHSLNLSTSFITRTVVIDYKAYILPIGLSHGVHSYKSVLESYTYLFQSHFNLNHKYMWRLTSSLCSTEKRPRPNSRPIHIPGLPLIITKPSWIHPNHTFANKSVFRALNKHHNFFLIPENTRNMKFSYNARICSTQFT